MDEYGNSVAFVIDTDQYAGNFEREMCAYVTGRYGECGVGEEIVEDGIAEQFNNVIDMSDDSNCYRPVTCYPLKNSREYNGVAIFFDLNNPPTKEQIELMKERATNYGINNTSWKGKPDPINVTGFRLITFETAIQETEI